MSKTLPIISSLIKPDIYAENYFDLLERRIAQQGKFEYTATAYPFLHKAETTDVLSPFFEKKSRMGQGAHHPISSL